jgi:cold shock CspA family protein
MISGDSFLGTIIYWNAAKGFGFAKRDDGGPDAFVPIAEADSDLTSIPLGARIRFYLRQNPRTGREQACKTTVLRDAERLPGRVKCWHDSFEFAFVQSTDGREFYAHETAFTAGRIKDGARVEFEIATHPKNGKPIAIFVEPPSVSSGGIANVRFMKKGTPCES